MQCDTGRSGKWADGGLYRGKCSLARAGESGGSQPVERDPFAGTLTGQQALDVACDEVDLEVDRVTGGEAAEGGPLERVRNEQDLEIIRTGRVDGEADA